MPTGTSSLAPLTTPHRKWRCRKARAARSSTTSSMKLERQQNLSGLCAGPRYVGRGRSRESGQAGGDHLGHPSPYSRRVMVYVPKQYVPGTAAPFIVGARGPAGRLRPRQPDRRTSGAGDDRDRVGNGSGDAPGSQRGLEYDTMSGCYAQFVVIQKCCPLVEKQVQCEIDQGPEGRATMGGSSGGSAALIMAWYHP